MALSFVTKAIYNGFYRAEVMECAFDGLRKAARKCQSEAGKRYDGKPRVASVGSDKSYSVSVRKIESKDAQSK
jgi:hypothetical protein